MSTSVENLKDKIKDRIRSHSSDNMFNPRVTFEKAQLMSGETVVNFYVDLPKDFRSTYVKGYFMSDRHWVESRGNDYDITANFYCYWQV